VSSVTRPLSSSPTKKLAAHSTTTPFPDIGLAPRGAFFSGCGCLSVSSACNVGTNSARSPLQKYTKFQASAAPVAPHYIRTIVVAATFTVALYTAVLLVFVNTRAANPCASWNRRSQGANQNACATRSGRASRAEHAAYLSSKRSLHGEAVQMAKALWREVVRRSCWRRELS